MPATFYVLVQLLGTSLAPGPVGEQQIEEGSRQGSLCQTEGQRAESGQRRHREAASSGRLQGVMLQLLSSVVLVPESEGKEIPDTGNMSKAMGDRSVSSWMFTVHSGV